MINKNTSIEETMEYYFDKIKPFIGRRVYVELFATEDTHDIYDIYTNEYLFALPNWLCVNFEFCESDLNDLSIVFYGKDENSIMNISIEDEQTNEVIFSFEHY